MTMIPSTVGWFDHADQTEPTYEPGLSVPCPVCGTSLDGQPRVTISLMVADVPTRSYFYRAHKACWQALPEESKSFIEGEIIDAEVARMAVDVH